MILSKAQAKSYLSERMSLLLDEFFEHVSAKTRTEQSDWFWTFLAYSRFHGIEQSGDVKRSYLKELLRGESKPECNKLKPHVEIRHREEDEYICIPHIGIVRRGDIE